MKHATLTLSIAALATGLAAGSAMARGGSSSSGDSWLNDAQRNPRFIEPYADQDPSRYRASHPREGFYDRQIAADERGYRGQVRVRPYGY